MKGGANSRLEPAENPAVVLVSVAFVRHGSIVVAARLVDGMMLLTVERGRLLGKELGVRVGERLAVRVEHL